MKKTLNTLILLLSVSAGALANDAGIVRCRAIIEASARLACYDALVVPAVDAKAPVSKPLAQPDLRASPATPAPVTAAATGSLQQRTSQFGLEDRVSAATVDAIESYIPGRFEGWEAKSNIKLANGQVWQVADDSSRSVTMNDPKVRIRRGALGAFYLEFEKINHSPRVKRVL